MSINEQSEQANVRQQSSMLTCVSDRGKGKSFPCFECCRAFDERYDGISVQKTIAFKRIPQLTGFQNTKRAELASHVRSAHPVPPSSRKKRPATAVTPLQVSNSNRQGDSMAGAAIEAPSHGHPPTVAGQALADISGGINQQYARGITICDGYHNSTQEPSQLWLAPTVTTKEQSPASRSPLSKHHCSSQP